MVKIIFWLVWEFCDLEGALRFSVAANGLVAEGCNVVDIRLVDFGAMVLELNSRLGVAFVWSWVVCRNGLLVEWLV